MKPRTEQSVDRRDYRFSQLPPHVLKELQTFEAKLSSELGKEVILICYDDPR
ncbi:hypothetical protein [Kyrpidia tusciae]|uniref:Uncharacterized protein n=1 Tax=Kyrpidia tusciae (strain DSM 2912 / NBRC 15312 / T2) TaxID=562970 RepID=D5WQQ2_KYRT2|nr:hypothetical protein [Kyrpidia tusciae]ADG06661.1 hypothetical protein Btus_1966 [Kyrpidia tusciae DSM 2912]MBE3551434.1 hypothetical protein [Kyrpidia tusciae]